MAIVFYRKTGHNSRRGKYPEFGLKIGQTFDAESILQVKLTLACVLTDIGEGLVTTDLSANRATRQYYSHSAAPVSQLQA